MKHTGAGTLFLLLTLLPMTLRAATCEWPAWQQFRQNYVSEQGRVIDTSSAQKITTSEGQSYALFFALVADDRATFDTLLQWTEDNLARGDLSARLPAWLWGENAKKQWGVLDANSASDSDLWIAYSLLEAGRLWQIHRYQSLGMLLLQRIAREETADLPGLGVMLLPGKKGFARENRWTLNPSYQPPQLLARLARYHGPWKAMRAVNQRLLLESSPKGFAPDWIDWVKDQGWQPTADKHNEGSYNAIRVYLWAGMMADDDADKAALLRRWQPMADATAQAGVPPEIIDTASGQTRGGGPVGFSAALLPFLQGNPAQAVQRQRVTQNPPGADAYYSAVLTLFGQGWDQQRFRFNTEGELLPQWDSQCVSTH